MIILSFLCTGIRAVKQEELDSKDAVTLVRGELHSGDIGWVFYYYEDLQVAFFIFILIFLHPQW